MPGWLEFRERFFLLLVHHIEAAAFVGEIEIVDTEHAHAKADFRANRDSAEDQMPLR